MDYRRLLNKKDPVDRIILEESETGNLDVNAIGVKGYDKKEKKRLEKGKVLAVWSFAIFIFLLFLFLLRNYAQLKGYDVDLVSTMYILCSLLGLIVIVLCEKESQKQRGKNREEKKSVH